MQRDLKNHNTMAERKKKKTFHEKQLNTQIIINLLRYKNIDTSKPEILLDSQARAKLQYIKRYATYADEGSSRHGNT